MELLLKAVILAVILIVIAAVGFYIFTKAASTTLTRSEAVQTVVSDLGAKSPAANITVINVTNSSLGTRSWAITLRVTYNTTRPCPTLEIEVFDYPVTGLVPSLDNVYTSDCHLAQSLADAPYYVISSPYIAITRSYISNNTMIKDYVDTYGYNNTYVTATFVASNTTINLANAWLVRYRATNAKYSVYAILSQSGSVIEAYNASN
jgi:hypothetical protein